MSNSDTALAVGQAGSTDCEALWHLALRSSTLAHNATEPAAQILLFGVKHQAINACFELAYRLGGPPAPRPRVRLHPGMKFKGAPVYSIRMRGGKKLHLPSIFASPLVKALAAPIPLGVIASGEESQVHVQVDKLADRENGYPILQGKGE